MLVVLLVLLIFFRISWKGSESHFYFIWKVEERGRGGWHAAIAPQNFFLIINIHSLMIISLRCVYLFIWSSPYKWEWGENGTRKKIPTQYINQKICFSFSLSLLSWPCYNSSSWKIMVEHSCICLRLLLSTAAGSQKAPGQWSLFKSQVYNSYSKDYKFYHFLISLLPLWIQKARVCRTSQVEKRTWGDFPVDNSGTELPKFSV